MEDKELENIKLWIRRLEFAQVVMGTAAISLTLVILAVIFWKLP